MKKFFKLIALAPILLVLMLCSFACGSTPKLESIALSIQGASFASGYYNIDKNDSGYTIKTTLSSNDFDVYDLTWKSSNTNVATVYYNKLKTVGVGETTITATYKNSDGTEVKGIIRINVNSSSPLITFPNGNSTIYNGEDQKFIEKFRANGDDGSGKFIYSYYDYTTGGEPVIEQNAQLKDVGRYKIICTSATNNKIQTTKDVFIEKRPLLFTAKDFNPIAYGEALPSCENDAQITLKDSLLKDSLYNENNIPSDYDILNGSYNEIKGVGADKDVVIGKYVYITNAKKGSGAATYQTSVHFVLDTSNALIERNYSTEAIITKGAITITPRNVVVKLEEQSDIIYGSSVLPNKYALYDYDVYHAAGTPTNLLEDVTVNYASNIILGEPTFKFETGSDPVILQVATLNNSGVLNVRYSADGREILPYQLFYESATTSSGNVIIREIVSTKITINPRPVTVLPIAGQSKVYGTVDPVELEYSLVSGSFLPKDNITPFLFVDYSAVAVNNENTDASTLGVAGYNYNINAPYQSDGYAYKIESQNKNIESQNKDIESQNKDIESQNKNYDIQLSAAGESVRFFVEKCPVYIELSSIVANYKEPTADEKYLVSYFIDENSDDETKANFHYSTQITRLNVNGKELVTHDKLSNKYSLLEEYMGGVDCNGQTYGKNYVNNGVIYLIANKTPNSPTASNLILDTLALTIQIDCVKYKIEESGDFYAKYRIVLDQGVFIDGNEANYNLAFNGGSTLTVNKTKLIVTPTKTEKLFSKEYDATNTIEQKNFGWAPSAANPDVFFTLSDNTIDITDIVENSQLLTLQNAEDQYLKEGVSDPVSNMISAGRYEVMLKYDLKEGCDHYEIVLDDTQKYYYTVKPKPVIVKPSSGQKKTYASVDDVFKFEIESSELPDGLAYNFDTDREHIINSNGDNIVDVKGQLSRVSGENVGEYDILLGTLNFGENFIVSLASTPVKFSITPREVTITPISYSLRYGDEEPASLSFYEDIGDSQSISTNILVKPTYTGNFVLMASGEVASKVGSYYPVRVDNSGYVVGYSIAQGTFTANSNYEVKFVGTSTYTVSPREIVINITSQQKEASEHISLSLPGEFDKSLYSVSNLVDSPNYALSNLVIDSNENGSAYLIKNNGPTDLGYDFVVTKDGKDITSCYIVTIGKNIVYNINVAVIYLSIVDGSLMSSTVNITYSGEVFTNNRSNPDNKFFTLVNQTEGYEIVNQENVDFVYTSLSPNPPKDAGSYRVSINTSGFRLVIKKISTKEEIEFNELSSEKVVNNCVLSVSNVAYLNIAKADLTYNSSLIGFDYGTESGLEYGNEVLPSLLEEVEDPVAGIVRVFQGVDGEEVCLRKYSDRAEELNYRLTAANDDYKKFDANARHTLNITVEVADPLDISKVNANYNSLNINVPIIIIPAKIEYHSTLFHLMNRGQEMNSEEIVYNGYATTARLALLNESNLEISSQNISKTNKYYKILTTYEGETSKYAYKEWDGTLGTEILYAEFDKYFFINQEMTLYGNNGYALVNGRALLISQSDVAPVDAGFYVSLSTIVTNKNYSFYDKQTDINLGQSFSQACIYEVKRSNNIDISWSEEENIFKYTTPFDFANTSSLEFVYSIPNVFKEYVVFSNLKNKSGVTVDVPADNVLNINEYFIDLTVNSPNFYKSETVTFKVVPLTAEIILPLVNTFVYTQLPVSSFLDDIGVILRNRDNYVENTFYYTSVDTNFAFEITEVGGDNKDELDVEYSVLNMPKMPGGYTINITYGVDGESNYYGTSVFSYSIVKRTFTGAITFKNAEVVYNPNYTEQNIFNIAKQSMFNISDSAIRYNLELYWVTKSNVSGENKYVLIGHDYTTPINKEDLHFYNEDSNKFLVMDATANQNEDSFKAFAEFYSVAERQKTVTLVLNFAEEEYLQDREMSAIITIAPYELEGNKFYYKNQNTNYYYNGYAVYHELVFDGVNLTPSPDLVGKSVKTSQGYTVAYQSDYKIAVTDKLGKSVFSLKYEYSKYNTLEATPSYNNISSAPIVPNEVSEAVGNKIQESYLVAYKFAFGENYNSANVRYDVKSFKIEKVPLHIKVNAGAVVSTQYDEGVISGYIDNILLQNSLVVANSETINQTNMKITCSKGASPSGYREQDGVYIRLFAKTTTGEPLTDYTQINVGSYKLYVSLVCNDNYDLSKFFTKINFYNMDSIPIGTYIDAQTGGEYSNSLEVGFSITPANCPYNINNYSDIIQGDAGDISYEVDGLVSWLNINKSGGVNLSCPADYTLYLVDVETGNNTGTLIDLATFDFSSLTTSKMYRLRIKYANSNYSDGGILFKVVEDGGVS